MYRIEIAHDTALIWLYALRYELANTYETFTLRYIRPNICQLDNEILYAMADNVENLLNDIVVNRDNRDNIRIWKKFLSELHKELERRESESL